MIDDKNNIQDNHFDGFKDKTDLLRKIKELDPDNKFDAKVSMIDLINEWIRLTSLQSNQLDGKAPLSIVQNGKTKIDKAELYKTMSKLVRVSITCLDPSMSNITADSIVVGNKYGTTKAVFPTNTSSYYLPKACVDALIDNHYKFTTLRKIRPDEKKLKENQIGDFTVTHVREIKNRYKIEILPHLTKEELLEVQKRVKE